MIKFFIFACLIVLSALPAQAAQVCLQSASVSDESVFMVNSHPEMLDLSMGDLFGNGDSAPSCGDVRKATKVLNVVTLTFSGAATVAGLCGPEGVVVSAGFAGASLVTGYLALQVADISCEDGETQATVEEKAKRVVCDVLASRNMPCDPGLLK